MNDNVDQTDEAKGGSTRTPCENNAAWEWDAAFGEVGGPGVSARPANRCADIEAQIKSTIAERVNNLDGDTVAPYKLAVKSIGEQHVARLLLRVLASPLPAGDKDGESGAVSGQEKEPEKTDEVHQSLGDRKKIVRRFGQWAEWAFHSSLGFTRLAHWVALQDGWVSRKHNAKAIAALAEVEAGEFSEAIRFWKSGELIESIRLVKANKDALEALLSHVEGSFHRGVRTVDTDEARLLCGALDLIKERGKDFQRLLRLAAHEAPGRAGAQTPSAEPGGEASSPARYSAVLGEALAFHASNERQRLAKLFDHIEANDLERLANQFRLSLFPTYVQRPIGPLGRSEGPEIEIPDPCKEDRRRVLDALRELNHYVTAGDFRLLDHLPWPAELRLKTGLFLFKCVMQTTVSGPKGDELLVRERLPYEEWHARSDGEKQPTLDLGVEMPGWAKKAIAESFGAWPMKLPLPFPPTPWRRTRFVDERRLETFARGAPGQYRYVGAFASIRESFIRRREHPHTNQLHDPVSDFVLSAANRLQGTRWQINESVLSPARTLMKLCSSGAMRRRSGVSRSLGLSLQLLEEASSDAGPSAASRSAIAVAELLLKEASSGFYFPYNIDWRGRFYPMVWGLAPDGNKLVRSLLKFVPEESTYGRTHEIRDGELRQLKRQIANAYGRGPQRETDDCPKGAKGQPEAMQLEWVDKSNSLIEAFVANAKHLENPAGQGVKYLHPWWEKTDNPWLLLATASEYLELRHGTHDRPSCVPIYIDGSANVVQHFAALTRCADAARKVNLLPPTVVRSATRRERTEIALVRERSKMDRRQLREAYELELAEGADLVEISDEWECIEESLDIKETRRLHQLNAELEAKERATTSEQASAADLYAEVTGQVKETAKTDLRADEVEDAELKMQLIANLDRGIVKKLMQIDLYGGTPWGLQQAVQKLIKSKPAKYRKLIRVLNDPKADKVRIESILSKQASKAKLNPRWGRSSITALQSSEWPAASLGDTWNAIQSDIAEWEELCTDPMLADSIWMIAGAGILQADRRARMGRLFRGETDAGVSGKKTWPLEAVMRELGRLANDWLRLSLFGHEKEGSRADLEDKLPRWASEAKIGLEDGWFGAAGAVTAQTIEKFLRLLMDTHRGKGGRGKKALEDTIAILQKKTKEGAEPVERLDRGQVAAVATAVEQAIADWFGFGSVSFGDDYRKLRFGRQSYRVGLVRDRVQAEAKRLLRVPYEFREALEAVVEKLQTLPRNAAPGEPSGRPTQWTAPSGLRILSGYYDLGAMKAKKAESGSHRFALDGKNDGQSSIRDYDFSAPGPLREDKQVGGISPNVVHSLDASHLANIINIFGRQGLTEFIAVHDCLGMLAADVEIAKRTVTFALHDLYRNFTAADLLKELWRSSCGPLPSGPADCRLIAPSLIEALYDPNLGDFWLGKPSWSEDILRAYDAHDAHRNDALKLSSEIPSQTTAWLTPCHAEFPWSAEKKVTETTKAKAKGEAQRTERSVTLPKEYETFEIKEVLRAPFVFC